MKPPIFQRIEIKHFKSIKSVNITKLENFNVIVDQNSLGKSVKVLFFFFFKWSNIEFRILICYVVQFLGQLHFFEAIFFLIGSNSSIINVNHLNEIKYYARNETFELFGNNANLMDLYGNMNEEYTVTGVLIYSNNKLLTIYRSMQLNDVSYSDQYKINDKVILLKMGTLYLFYYISIFFFFEGY